MAKSADDAGLSVVAPPDEETKPTKPTRKKAAKKRTAKKRPAKGRAKRPASGTGRTIQYNVHFQQVSIGQDTARVGCKILRDSITPTVADQVLCGRRLDCDITVIEGDVGLDQQELPGIKRSNQMRAVADVKQISVYPRHISCGLTFNLKEIDIEEFAGFAKQRGVLVVNSIESLDEIAEAEKQAKDKDREAKKAEKATRRRGRRKA